MKRFAKPFRFFQGKIEACPANVLPATTVRPTSGEKTPSRTTSLAQERAEASQNLANIAMGSNITR
jgi:hypothetical protein